MRQVAADLQHEELQARERLHCFAVLWALSTLFQLFAMGSVIRSWVDGTPQGFVELTLAFAAGAVIWRPGLKPLLLMAGLQIADALILFPHLPNNRLLSSLVNMTLLLAAARHFSTGERRDGRVFMDFSRTVRCELIAFYFFAVFAKLNTGFLSSSTSCASAFYSRMAAWFPLAPLNSWAVESIIYVTIACEALIPMLLFFRRTRGFGIALGILFHSALSIDYYQHTMDFGSLLFALFFLFAPQNFLLLVREKFFSKFDAQQCSAFASRIRLAFLTCAAAILAAGLSPGQSEQDFFYYGKHVLWYSYAVLIAVGYLIPAISGRRTSVALHSPFRLSGALMTLPLVLLILNGCGPYIGFKSRSSFDMYSNLRMEQPKPNHLLVPSSLDVFGWQGDRVQILESNDPWLQDSQRRGYDITYFEFAQRVHAVPDIQVRYLRNGTEHSIRTEEERQAMELPPALARKFLWFRSIDLQPLARCDW